MAATRIQALYDELVAARDAHLKATEPQRREAEALRAQIAPLEAKLRVLDDAIRQRRDADKFDEVSRELAKLQRVIEDASGTGPKRVTLSAQASTTGATPGKVG